MNKAHRFHIQEKIIRLARSKNTGSPESLAERYDVSPRTVKRLIKMIRESGIPIIYCRTRGTYFIE